MQEAAGGGSGGIRMTEAAARQVRNRFDDLAAAFRNTRGELETITGLLDEAAGEFAGSMAAGSGAFAVSWREAFSVCSRTSAVIAGNTNQLAVDLDRLDIDTSTSIRL